MGTTLRKFLESLWAAVEPIVTHGIATLVAITFIALTGWFLTLMLGNDPKLYDAIPIRYVMHTIDLTMFVRFVYKVWSAFR